MKDVDMCKLYLGKNRFRSIKTNATVLRWKKSTAKNCLFDKKKLIACQEFIDLKVHLKDSLFDDSSSCDKKVFFVKNT